ncbi:hypothetical protein BBH99_12880 [Chryseobacterium contaminans]|uniref:Uncharacterized protein n=1 Tax=Chryseobacterium contaminans TaxID=1423959 RepID=A0ABX2X1Z6_9FLAO|nr:hypothetical protein BBH99_12880 [Chryseobacterium contaminans]
MFKIWDSKPSLEKVYHNELCSINPIFNFSEAKTMAFVIKDIKKRHKEVKKAISINQETVLRILPPEEEFLR